VAEPDIDAEYQKRRVQNDALWELHDELDSLLHTNQLKSDTVNSRTVTKWFRMLHNIVQDGLQRPRYPFPDPGLKSRAEEPAAGCPMDKS
jgi:hypothetical protein